MLLAMWPEFAVAADKDAHALFGMWAEKCDGGRVVLITPQYHAVVYGMESDKAVGLGRIERFDRHGDEITIVLSAQFLREKGEETPKYKLVGKGKILAVRNRAFWSKSESIYRDSPSLRPDNYVDLGEKEYGLTYSLCSKNADVVERRMWDIVEKNERYLESR